MGTWLRRRRVRDEATCAEVARVLQRHLDGEIDELTARRVERHLERCRRCGLEARTYEAIKDALSRAAPVDRGALERLREFGRRLADEAPDGRDTPA